MKRTGVRHSRVRNSTDAAHGDGESFDAVGAGQIGSNQNDEEINRIFQVSTNPSIRMLTSLFSSEGELILGYI